MNAVDIILLLAGFAVGASLGCLPDPSCPERKLGAVGILSFSLGIFVSFLAVAAAGTHFAADLVLQAIVMPTGWIAAYWSNKKTPGTKLASSQ
jgi:hypothetical protein